MSNQALIQKIDDTLIKMYTEDYECENANQQIYNALLYQFIMLRILATEMDDLLVKNKVKSATAESGRR